MPDRFMPVDVRWISDAIIEQLRDMIHTGRLVQGTRLPSERELCTPFGVSRVTVREALRVLEASGLVEIRVGAGGGAFVTTPTSDHVGTGITDMIALAGFTALEVTEARQLIDLGVVDLACSRATEQDIAALTAICDLAEAMEGRGEYPVELSAEFHVRLAESTHNAAITMLVQTLREPMQLSLQRAHEIAPDMGPIGVAEHRAITEAVQHRDVERARRIMTEHLARTLLRVRDDHA